MEKIRNLKFENKIFVLAFITLGLIALLFRGEKKENLNSPAPQVAEAVASVDTFIPRGLSLLPVELTNADSLGSLIGELGGVVDLYLPSDEKRKTPYKVASRVKLIRAPHDPQKFATLLKAEDNSKLLSLKGPFVAIVQNPDSKGTELTESTKKSVHIDYQN